MHPPALSRGSLSWVAVAVWVSLCSTIHAQTALDTLTGSPGDFLGFQVAPLGDRNSDGITDFALSTAGVIEIRSGTDRSLLDTWNHPHTLFRNVGDFNQDGIPDLAVTNAGTVELLSGVDGSTIQSIASTCCGSRVPYAVSRAGDVDGDGWDDLILGIPGQLQAFVPGDAEVWSVQTGTRLHHFPGNFQEVNYAIAVEAVGDLNNDGFDDVAIGAPMRDSVIVHSGADGAVLATIDGVTGAFGSSLLLIPDANGDARPDLAIGAPNDNASSGRIDFVSPIDQAVLQTWFGATGSSLGDTFEFAGDVDGDGCEDFLASGDDGFEIWSGKNGVRLYRFDDHALPIQIRQAAALGDVNGDGLGDFVITDWSAPSLAVSSGVATVIGGSDLWLHAEPRVAPVGSTLNLTLRPGTPGNRGMIAIISVNGAGLFLNLSGIKTFDATGTLSFSASVLPVLSGIEMTCWGLGKSAAGPLLDSEPEVIQFP